MMREDFYNRKARLETFIKKIREDKSISENNKKYILAFKDDCFARGLTTARVNKYLLFLRKIASVLKKDFKRVTREDMKRFIAEIEQSDYSEWTKTDMKVIVKRFWKWLKETNETRDDVKWYPKEVSWIRTTMKNPYRKLPEDILTPEEVKAIIHVARSIRDKAFVSTLYESGCRIGEILGMNIKSVEFSELTCSIKVYSQKTRAYRRILLVDSTPFLSNWVTHHPLRDDPEAPLWVSLGTKNHLRRLSYGSALCLLQSLAKKAGVKKKVNPHAFRHARATHLATILTEAQMKEYFGWTQGSKMASVYVHLSGRDVDSAILKMHGLRKPEGDDKDKKLGVKICPICGQTNEFDLQRCRRCGRPLDVKKAMEIARKEKELMKMITPEMVEEMIERKVREILTAAMGGKRPSST